MNHFEASLLQKQDLYRILIQVRDHETAIEHAVAAGEQAIPWLVEWVTRERERVRFRAVEALKRLDKEKVIPYLLIKLNTVFDKDDGFFYLALEIAHAYKDPRIPEFILEQHGLRLKTAISDQLHMATLDTLADVGDRSHTYLLAESLKALKHKVPDRREFWFPYVGCVVGLGLFAAMVLVPLAMSLFREGPSSIGTGDLAWMVLVGLYMSACLFAPIYVPSIGLLIWRHLRWIKTVSQLQEVTNKLGNTFVRWGAVEGIGVLAVCASDPLLAKSANEPLVTLLGVLQTSDPIALSDDDRSAVQKLLMSSPTDLLQSHLILALPYLMDKPLLEWLEKQVAHAQLSDDVQQDVLEVMPVLRRGR